MPARHFSHTAQTAAIPCDLKHHNFTNPVRLWNSRTFPAISRTIDSTLIRRAFDRCSTVRGHWGHSDVTRAADPLVTVTLTYLFTRHYAPPSHGWEVMHWWRSLCLRRDPRSTMEGHCKLRIGRKEAHHTGDPWSHLKVERSKVKAP